MTQAILFKFALATLLLIWPAAVHVEQFESMMRKQGLVMVPKSGAMWVEVKP